MSGYVPPDAARRALGSHLLHDIPAQHAVAEACRIAVIAELDEVLTQLLAMREFGGIGSAIEYLHDRIDFLNELRS